MGADAAIRLAIDLMQVPSRVRLARKAPLPDGLELLLKVAADESDAIDAAALLTSRPPQTLKSAASFFIEQILLAPDTDSYRVLGARAESSTTELRRNMALLVRHLHPDTNQNAGKSIFAGRVSLAWNDLKTPERRAAYDHQLAAQESRGVNVRSSPPGTRRRRRAAHFIAKTNPIASGNDKADPTTPENCKTRPISLAASLSPAPSLVVARSEPKSLLHRVLLLLFGRARQRSRHLR